jgi:predicted anti-sigma-YlaC factor YlaD
MIKLWLIKSVDLHQSRKGPGKMVKNINDNCESVKILMDVYLNQRIESFEIANHLKNCLSCREIWTADLRLKKQVKRAVEKTCAPQSLIDSIKMQIRR